MGKQKYKMSFSTGGLLLAESIAVAGLHQHGESWDTTLARALADEATHLPKAASNRRTLREIVNRLQTLSQPEIEYLVDVADRADAQALLWLSACRAYQIIREFAIEVLQDRYLSYQMHLPPETFDIFFEMKADCFEVCLALGAPSSGKLSAFMEDGL